MKKEQIAFCTIMLSINLVSQVYAQQPDTILQLQPVNVTGSRSILFTIGNYITEFDSASIENSGGKNLAELLSSSSTIFIKTYGSGGSATISSRGTEARHSSVLWNGFNINSSTLGLTDLSLVPIAAPGSIRLIHGGSGPVNGNSALGSTIVMEQSEPVFIKSMNLRVDAEAGSFGNRHLAITSKYNSGFVVSKTVVFADEATNNFDFVNLAHRDKPVQKQQHAANENYGLHQDVQFKIKSNHFLSASLWYQVNKREIPAMMTVPESSAEQRDSIIRTFIGYKIVNKKSVIKISGGYFREYQYYNDSDYEIDLDYLNSNFHSEAEYRLFISEKLIVSNGIAYTYSQAKFGEYKQIRNRDQTAFFSNVYYQPLRGWKINAGLRKVIATGENPPLSPFVGLEGNLYRNKILIVANTGIHYNLPSMNDLYWIPGGNPLLKPEHAWNREAGFIFMKYDKKFPSISITAYNALVDNWIKWQPVSGGIYTPDNLRQVKTSGIETSLKYKKQITPFQTELTISYTLSKSVLSKSNDAYSESIIGKQLMYIPESIFNVLFNLNYKSLTLHFNHTYTGERFTTSDHSGSLEGFHYADLTLNKVFKLKKNTLNFFFGAMNLYNTQYQVIVYRPTPGRWYRGGFKMNFNLSKIK